MGLRKIKSFLSKRRSFRSQVAILIVGVVIFFYLLIVLLNSLDGNEEDAIIYNIVKGIPKDSKEHPILIWWTPFTGENGAYKQCGNDICFFTDEKKYFSDPLTKVMKLFNHTATFRRESDLPLTLQYLESVESLKSKKFFVPTSVKNAKGKELAPVVYVQSDCNTPSERDSYVEELSKHIPVDSYGKCLHNKELPPELSDAMSGMNSDAFWFTLSQYKFNLAFENAVCRDYITEKLWRPLVIGSVPIYYGSPAVEDWLPNPDSAILTKNFASPKQLAEHLLRLQTDDEAYERYLEHKILGKISNQRLIEALSNREWGINNDHTKRNFIECFECMVCKRVAHNHRRALKGNMPLKYQANLNHYGCPEPVSPFTLKPDSQSWWLELHNKAKYEATALQNLMSRGMNFSSTDFYQEVINLLENSALQEE
ncbi:alpha-(1,3)-fucosyltransferase 10-like isoform X3 [Stegodyphus dumicola]|uniref:alpha-(1,3)-fucosyltransferase 10-like isoform X3 n=1 Tax=Stegodyphus dumicola TaxID=202533 RepID=UPI0015AEE9C7|nr:alpha-(1,3)-fucosyltransferase 10-like isoform X3 [Stegodyphus dumicola]